MAANVMHPVSRVHDRCRSGLAGVNAKNPHHERATGRMDLHHGLGSPYRGQARVPPAGVAVCSGQVDAVTEDGRILWLRPPAQNRRLFEKAEFYEAWQQRTAPASTKTSRRA
ncbi:hypothetical protein HNP00_002435 [Arthrobacter sp. AZCC_0090]|nr:hypothetical protein [Arthrobacter sp. AZCC_0090]